MPRPTGSRSATSPGSSTPPAAGDAGLQLELGGQAISDAAEGSTQSTELVGVVAVGIILFAAFGGQEAPSSQKPRGLTAGDELPRDGPRHCESPQPPPRTDTRSQRHRINAVEMNSPVRNEVRFDILQLAGSHPA
jgi:hypothetical protein